MKPSSRRAAAMTILVVFVALVALGLWQINGDEPNQNEGSKPSSVTYNDVAIGVPRGWSIVQLSQDVTCPQVQDEIVVVAPEGLGGDCRGAGSGDSRIWISALSPVETAPPTTVAVGNTTGWVRELPDGGGWIAALPDSRLQIAFNANVPEATRQSVVDSVTKR
jgi:hypothetical protein